MNKAELIDAVAVAADLSKASATRAVDAVFDNIALALKREQQANIAGFGSFVVRARAARAGRNPQTGAMIEIKAARVPTFKPGKALKDAVN
jgi:DNA-binding protein HU-beta